MNHATDDVLTAHYEPSELPKPAARNAAGHRGGEGRPTMRAYVPVIGAATAVALQVAGCGGGNVSPGTAGDSGTGDAPHGGTAGSSADGGQGSDSGGSHDDGSSEDSGAAADAGPADGSADAPTDAPACPTVSQVCADGGSFVGTCVLTWSAAQHASAWCSSITAPRVFLFPSCNGYDIVDVAGVDTATYYFYDEASGELVGIEGIGGLGEVCFAGIAPSVSIARCESEAGLVSLCAD